MNQNIHNSNKNLEKLVKLIENYIKITGYEEYYKIKRYTKNIDYLSIDYLKKNPELREQLEEDFVMMCRARLKDDFIEFCRRATLQIELIIDKFIKELEQAGKISVNRDQSNPNIINSIQISNDNNEYKGYFHNKFDFCLDYIQKNMVESYEKQEQKIIKRLNDNREIIHNCIELRNRASHRDSSKLNIINGFHE